MEEYINHFDKLFNTELLKSIDIKQLQILNSIYKRFNDELYTLMNKRKEGKKNIASSYNKLNETLIEKQKKILEKYCESIYDEAEDMEKQLFVFGFCIANELQKENRSIINKSKEL